MYRKIIIAVAAFIMSAAAVSAQEASKEKFKRYNRWMVGIELVKGLVLDIGDFNLFVCHNRTIKLSLHYCKTYKYTHFLL